jgi:POT family proton-dependent oligopeptide transporter
MSRNPDTAFFGHPRGLSTLFFTELWERFGYYGMRSLLVLFMTAPMAAGGFGFTDSKAYAIYGMYTASVYGVSVAGGWLADRFLGQRKAVLWGGVLIAFGYLSLAVPVQSVFFGGLAFVVAGTGLLKPNISTIVGQIYKPGDSRRDSGFSIFYMGINIGATVAPLICGYVGQRISWHLGFAIAGIGMALGVVQFALGQKHLGEAGAQPVPPADAADAATQRKYLRLGILAAAVLFGGIALVHFAGVHVWTAEGLSDFAGGLLLGVIVCVFAWLLFGGDWSAAERKRLMVIAVLFLGSALFWSAFEQAGSSLNLFAQRYTMNSFLGFEFPASWFQSMNAFFIVSLAPVFAWLWLRLGDRQPNSPMKFALGLFFGGLGFVVMMFGAWQTAGGSKVGPAFLLMTYFCHTVGELLLSPVGLSAMTKLAPAKVAGLMMGIWFLSLSAGNYLGGRIAAFYGDLPMSDLFRTIAIFTFIAAVVLALAAKPVGRLMGGVK